MNRENGERGNSNMHEQHNIATNKKKAPPCIEFQTFLLCFLFRMVRLKVHSHESEYLRDFDKNRKCKKFFFIFFFNCPEIEFDCVMVNERSGRARRGVIEKLCHGIT